MHITCFDQIYPPYPLLQFLLKSPSYFLHPTSCTLSQKPTESNECCLYVMEHALSLWGCISEEDSPPWASINCQLLLSKWVGLYELSPHPGCNSGWCDPAQVLSMPSQLLCAHTCDNPVVSGKYCFCCKRALPVAPVVLLFPLPGWDHTCS